MKKRFMATALCAATSLVVGEGCNHTCRRPYAPTCPTNKCCPPPACVRPGCAPGHPPAPPSALAPPPPAPVHEQPGMSAPPPPAPPPPNFGNTRPSYSSPPQDAWRAPSNGSVRLSDPPPPDVARKLPELGQPEPAKPSVIENRALTPPVGIPQFAIARDKVVGGLKPYLDGIDWLQAGGFRRALHLKKPGDEDDADRKVFENKGIKFQSLEVSPQTLRTVVDDFIRRVNDAEGHPLFVYDKDGSLAGGLWYLYYRLSDKLTHDDARAKAAQLGLKETGDSRDMWLAIQKLLSEAK